MSDNRTTIVLGGIIKHSNGIGFKLTFPTKKQANYYKEMIQFILINDKYNIKNKNGYYDKKKEVEII